MDPNSPANYVDDAVSPARPGSTAYLFASPAVSSPSTDVSSPHVPRVPHNTPVTAERNSHLYQGSNPSPRSIMVGASALLRQYMELKGHSKSTSYGPSDAVAADVLASPRGTSRTPRRDIGELANAETDARSYAPPDSVWSEFQQDRSRSYGPPKAASDQEWKSVADGARSTQAENAKRLQGMQVELDNALMGRGGSGRGLTMDDLSDFTKELEGVESNSEEALMWMCAQMEDFIEKEILPGSGMDASMHEAVENRTHLRQECNRRIHKEIETLSRRHSSSGRGDRGSQSGMSDDGHSLTGSEFSDKVDTKVYRSNPFHGVYLGRRGGGSADLQVGLQVLEKYFAEKEQFSGDDDTASVVPGRHMEFVVRKGDFQRRGDTLFLRSSAPVGVADDKKLRVLHDDDDGDRSVASARAATSPPNTIRERFLRPLSPRG